MDQGSFVQALARDRGVDRKRSPGWRDRGLKIIRAEDYMTENYPAEIYSIGFLEDLLYTDLPYADRQHQYNRHNGAHEVRMLCNPRTNQVFQSIYSPDLIHFFHGD
ncbi:MAG: hypothetical protein D5R96_04870 [Methanocalculus sp. MSAO_Arc2]|nr:MAG: hypothetical protein D5R96_04870 [Methanocalculus sp. MSAO_Arc2]